MAELLGGSAAMTAGPVRCRGRLPGRRAAAGSTTGPLVLLTPAWDDVFGYQDLALSSPDVRVLALAYVEQQGQRVSRPSTNS